MGSVVGDMDLVVISDEADSIGDVHDLSVLLCLGPDLRFPGSHDHAAQPRHLIPLPKAQLERVRIP